MIIKPQPLYLPFRGGNGGDDEDMMKEVGRDCNIVEENFDADVEEQVFGSVGSTAPSPFGEGDGG